MTLVLKLDLDMVKMYHYTKNEVSMLRHSRVIACTDKQTDRQIDTQTDRQYENITFPHRRVVNINFPILEHLKKKWIYYTGIFSS